MGGGVVLVVQVSGPRVYYNYATYTDVYGRGTVIVGASVRKFLCPRMGRVLYVSYKLYSGMYPVARESSVRNSCSGLQVFTIEGGGDSIRCGSSDNNVFSMLSSFMLNRNKCIMNTMCGSGVRIVRVVAGSESGTLGFEKDGCIRDSVGSVCVGAGGVLAKKNNYALL